MCALFLLAFILIYCIIIIIASSKIHAEDIHWEDNIMIDLDDRVTNIRLGIDEYNAIRALGVESIRDLLLLDVDRVLTLRGYDQIVRNRLVVWQKLLRKYLTYEKLHDARPFETPPEDELTIRDSVTEGDFASADADFLMSLNVVDFLALLDADPDSELYDEETSARLRALQEQYTIKEPPETPKEESGRYIPPPTVTPDQFFDELIAETGLMDEELDILESMQVETVRDFIDLDLENRASELGLDEETTIRLSSWQRYLKKRLHVV